MKIRRPFLLLVLALVAVAVGCGARQLATDPRLALKDTADAWKDAKSVRTDTRLTVQMLGSPRDPDLARYAGSPIALHLQSVSAKPAKLNVKGDVSFAGVTMHGEARMVDQQALYVDLPIVFGARWQRISLAKLEKQQKQLRAQVKRRPEVTPAELVKLFSGLRLDSIGDQRTISADLDVSAAMDLVIEKVDQATGTAASDPEAAKLKAAVVEAVKRAHGELTIGSDNLPRRFHAIVLVRLPKPQEGVTGVRATLDVRMSDWNAPVTLKAPSGAVDLDPTRLLQDMMPQPPAVEQQPGTISPTASVTRPASS